MLHYIVSGFQQWPLEPSLALFLATSKSGSNSPLTPSLLVCPLYPTDRQIPKKKQHAHTIKCNNIHLNRIPLWLTLNIFIGMHVLIFFDLENIKHFLTQRRTCRCVDDTQRDLELCSRGKWVGGGQTTSVLVNCPTFQTHCTKSTSGFPPNSLWSEPCKWAVICHYKP